MRIRTRQWKFPNYESDHVLSHFPRFTKVEGIILTGLGFTSQDAAIDFLNDHIQYVDDPYMLSGMDVAEKRIKQAIHAGEAITIYADYDADGVTSAALLYTVLKRLGGIVDVYFPDRFKEGYGLNSGAVESLARRGTSLVISVDCGIRAVEQAKLARQLGMDLIITDHHHPPQVLPPAVAILNPNQVDDSYPHKELAGVGVAYKLAQALSQDAPGLAEMTLELVAIGTVADMSRLVGENRALVKRGLEQLNAEPSLGLKSLIQSAGYHLGRLNAGSIGFGIGPRINAAGRLKHAELAFNLLTSENETQALNLAQELDGINKRRQDLTQQVVEAAEQSLGEEDARVLFTFDTLFHEGVVGLAASRLADTYYRPAFVGKVGSETTRISARSIPGFHLTRALEQCAELLDRFGGHAAAAGLTLSNETREAFCERFNAIAAAELDEEQLTPVLGISAEVHLPDLDERLLKFHDRLAPLGEGNEWPILASRGVEIVDRRQVGAEGRHLKLRVRGDGRVMEAIAFRMGDRLRELPDKVDIAFRLERNEYMGQVTPQMNVVEIRPALSS